MSPFAGPLFAASLLLAAAGLAKVTRPAATRVALRTAGLPSGAVEVRLLGVAEVAVAAIALIGGGAVPAAVVALTYVAFAGFAGLLSRRSRGRASCGCFGSSQAPVGRLHVLVNLAVAAAVAGAVASPAEGMTGLFAGDPAGTAALLGLAAVLAWSLYLALTALPELLAATKRRGSAVGRIRVGGVA